MDYKQEQIIKDVSSEDTVAKATITFKDGTTFTIDRTEQKVEEKHDLLQNSTCKTSGA